MGLRQFLTTETSLKTMKTAIYFMLKALFVLKIFTFLAWLYGYVENGLIGKLWLISKFMTSQIGQQIITIRILPNISRKKGNQATYFGQLIKYSLRKISLQKLCRKLRRETSSRLLFCFLKKLCIRQKQEVSTSVLIFGRPRLGHTMRQTV